MNASNRETLRVLRKARALVARKGGSTQADVVALFDWAIGIEMAGGI